MLVSRDRLKADMFLSHLGVATMTREKLRSIIGGPDAEIEAFVLRKETPTRATLSRLKPHLGAIVSELTREFFDKTGLQRGNQ